MQEIRLAIFSNRNMLIATVEGDLWLDPAWLVVSNAIHPETKLPAINIGFAPFGAFIAPGSFKQLNLEQTAISISRPSAEIEAKYIKMRDAMNAQLPRFSEGPASPDTPVPPTQISMNRRQE